jgi:hypothetical protein
MRVMSVSSGEIVMRTVAAKMGVKEGARAIFANAPATALAAIAPPDLAVASRLTGAFDYIHLFTTSRQELDGRFPALRAHLRTTGMLWVSWPKNRQLGTDLSLPEVIRIGYRHGLVESKTLSVDATWSAMKFTHPVPGKVYNNRYGKLPSR